MNARPLLLALALWLVLPLAGRVRAQDIPDVQGVCVECGHTIESHGTYEDCPCCNPGGGAGGGDDEDGGYDEGAQGGGNDALLEVITAPVIMPVFFAVGLGFGFAWMVQRLSGETEQGIFEYLDGQLSSDDGSEQPFALGAASLALGGLVTMAIYLPVLGVTELVGAIVDDDGEASARVEERAAEVRAEHAAAHEAFVAAHPPPPPSPWDEASVLRAVDEVTARRARADDVSVAVNDVTATPAPAAPAWSTASLVDPTTRTVAPPSPRAPATFVVPPPPVTTVEADRAAGVLERARRLLREGAAEAREGVIDALEDGAMGLLPDRVERALRANLAAQEGSLATLERVRDEGVPLLAFGSARELGALERDLERRRLDTAEQVLDEVQGDESDDDWLDLARRGLRAQESGE